MSPEQILKQYSDELIQELVRLEADGQIELLAGDITAYKTVLSKLVEVGLLLEVDFEKYEFVI